MQEISAFANNQEVCLQINVMTNVMIKMYYKITSVLTRALIGQYPCLDQNIQTRKFPAKRFFLK